MEREAAKKLSDLLLLSCKADDSTFKYTDSERTLLTYAIMCGSPFTASQAEKIGVMSRPRVYLIAKKLLKRNLLVVIREDNIGLCVQRIVRQKESFAKAWVFDNSCLRSVVDKLEASVAEEIIQCNKDLREKYITLLSLTGYDELIVPKRDYVLFIKYLCSSCQRIIRVTLKYQRSLKEVFPRCPYCEYVTLTPLGLEFSDMETVKREHVMVNSVDRSVTLPAWLDNDNEKV